MSSEAVAETAKIAPGRDKARAFRPPAGSGKLRHATTQRRDVTGKAGVDRLIETLEIQHLANRDPHLHFALLTDFCDAPEQVLPADELLLQRARAGVGMLNRKYPSQSRTFFFLFHRPRRWNTGEGLWMGYERKRGKLMEFNALLRGGSRSPRGISSEGPSRDSDRSIPRGECFSEIMGETAILPAIKYVITLDTDTQLPREAARRLVGTMAHPLNRPEFDPVRGIVKTRRCSEFARSNPSRS